MPIMPGSIIANGGSFAAISDAPIANLLDSGQLGFGPNLPNLDANTPPVFLPLQLVVTHVPTFFNYIDGGTDLFKAIYETHLQSFEGLDFAYSMEVEGTPVGRDGQMQNVPTRQVRSQPNPTAMWSEKIGNVIWNFHRLWMNAMHDPDTQASSMAGIIPVGTALPPLVASMFSADFMFIQYDSTYRPENIIDAFALTNVFPTEIGSPGYQLNAIETHRPERSVTFTGIVQHNRNTAAVARSLATLTNLHQVNYNDALPIAQSVEAQLQGEGMQRLVANVLDQFTPLDGSALAA